MDDDLKARMAMLRSISISLIPEGKTLDMIKYKKREVEKQVIKSAVKKEIQTTRPDDWLDAVEGGLDP